MRTNRAITAAAATLLATAALTGTAAAKDGFYVAPAVGWVLPQSVEAKDGADRAKLDLDNGWQFSGAIGYRLGQFRVEGELGYGELKNGTLTLNGTETSVRAKQNLFTGTAAGYYDITTGAIAPYVGAGAGFVTADLKNLSIAGLDLRELEGSSTDLLLFGEAGVSVAISDSLSIVPAYRYMWVNSGGDGVDNSTAHQLRVGLRYSF